jgi:intracellular septation protein
MQILFELMPLIAFFVAYKFADIYVATGVIVVAVCLQVGYRLIRRQKLTPLQIGSAILLLVFGGLTLALHDDRFILWKPTLYYWLVAGALLGGHLITGKPIVEKLMEGDIRLSHERWSRLSYAWIAVFLTLGCLNLYIAYNYSRDTWVVSKFVLIGLFMVFVMVQMWWIVVKWKGLPEEAPPPAEPTADERPR